MDTPKQDIIDAIEEEFNSNIEEWRKYGCISDKETEAFRYFFTSGAIFAAKFLKDNAFGPSAASDARAVSPANGTEGPAHNVPPQVESPVNSSGSVGNP